MTERRRAVFSLRWESLFRFMTQMFIRTLLTNIKVINIQIRYLLTFFPFCLFTYFFSCFQQGLEDSKDNGAVCQTIWPKRNRESHLEFKWNCPRTSWKMFFGTKCKFHISYYTLFSNKQLANKWIYTQQRFYCWVFTWTSWKKN